MHRFVKLVVRAQLIIMILVFIYGCKKSSDSQKNPSVHNFSGIVVIDNVGMPMGTWGTDDGDWSNDNYWIEDEFNLLNFPDTVSLDNTYLKDTTGWNTGSGIPEQQPQNRVIGYPNPANDRLTMFLGGFGLLKIKLNIVDSYYNSVFSYAIADGSSVIQLDISDSAIFKNGTVYRMYYSFSVKDSLNFYKGHGDILICRENELQDCMNFIP